MENISDYFKKFKNPNIIALLLLDAILIPLALITAILIRLGGEWDPKINPQIWILFLMPLWSIPILIITGFYNAVLEYLDETFLIIAIIGVSLTITFLFILIYYFGYFAIPKTSIIIFWVFALVYLLGSRLILRGIFRSISSNSKINNIAIYGAGSAGIQLFSSLNTTKNYNISCFIDDNKKLWGKTIKGKKIIPFDKLDKYIKLNKIDEVLLAIPSASSSQRKAIIKNLESLSIHVKTIPSIIELINGNIAINKIKEVNIDDLIIRDINHEKFLPLIKQHVFNKNILITGAGGSIGSELSRQIINLNPNYLVIIDISEYALYSIEKELLKINNYIKITMILGDITNQSLIDNVIKNYNINIIYHAAAYKHVPIVESNPVVGAYNNIIGTQVVANLALKNNIDLMVLISSDKAVRPTNIMGATKRVAEMLLQSLQLQSKHTIFTMVRFGNVLGSSGSVVPLFREQINIGGPITVTHPEVTRYFMTIPEAVELVINAGAMAKGGDVFLLDMGQPVKIVDLAKQMIHLSGLSIKDKLNSDGDIEIKYTGLRPGEKLFEELLIDANAIKTIHPQILKASEKFLDNETLNNYIIELNAIINNYDNQKIKIILQKLVNNYTPIINNDCEGL
jgi:FlaA1/EpsC-like NDP-sugar epimerase